MSAGLLAGLSIAQQTYSGYGIGSYCAANNGATPAGCFGAMTSFQRRQENSVFYRSPNWGGVSVKAVYAVNQPYTTSVTGSIATAQQGATAVSSGAALKPSVWGVSVTYDNGGFHGGLGYETHNNHTALGMKTIAAYMTTPVITLGSNNLTAATAGAFGAQLATFNTAAMTSSSDWGLNLNLRYNMANGFGVGAYWERLDYSWAYNAVSATSSSDVRDLSRDAYRLDATYRTGPHTVGITYGHANDIKGNTGALGFNGSGTATTEWMLDYAYSFSKRTSIFAYYNQMKNDTNARASGIVFNGITAAPGADPKYIGAGMKHTF
jgi:predicted porin